MIFENEEHAFRKYLELVAASASPRGFDPAAMRGRVYERECPACKRVNQWVVQDGIQRCGGFRCGNPRPWSAVFVPKGYCQMNPRRQALGGARDLLADLGDAFKTLTTWERRVWSIFVCVGTHRRTLHICWDHFPYGRVGRTEKVQTTRQIATRLGVPITRVYKWIQDDQMAGDWSAEGRGGYSISAAEFRRFVVDRHGFLGIRDIELLVKSARAKAGARLFAKEMLERRAA